MNTKQFIEHFKKQVYTRIGVSKISGVGVIAIRDIPMGTQPFNESRSCQFLEIPKIKIMDDPDIAGSVKKLVIDMCPEEHGMLYIPKFTMNELGAGFYLNHSKTPNMAAMKGGEDFIALRDIKEGEELTVDYGTYSEENLDNN